MLFKTSDLNIIDFISFNILIVDFNYAEFGRNYGRYFTLEDVGCSNQSITGCPGKGGWFTPTLQFQTLSYLYGLTSFLITKHASATYFYFDDADPLNLQANYLQSSSFIWANMSIFIVTNINCQNGGFYFNPLSTGLS